MIDRDALDHCLSAAATETLEGMAFVEVAPCPDGALPEDGDSLPDGCAPGAAGTAWRWSRLEVKAPLQGEILLVYPVGLATKLARTLYAGEAMPPDAESDVMGEILNALGGRCVAAQVGADATFTLGLPRSGDGWPADADAYRLVRHVIDDEHAFWIGARTP